MFVTALLFEIPKTSKTASVLNWMKTNTVEKERCFTRQLGRKEGNVLFNDALNTFYLRLYGVGHMVKNHSERERNVLFNDALNTFYLRLYGVRHMVKDHFDSEKGNPQNHSDRERGNPLPPHRLLLMD